MRKEIVLSSLLLCLSGGLLAAAGDFDMDFMQSVEDTNKSLSSNVASEDAKGSIADATELAGMFEKVEAVYVAKPNAPDAVAISRKSKELAKEIITLVSAKDFDTAAGKASELSRQCKACHNFYKKT